MLSFQQLNEVFDKPLPVKWVKAKYVWKGTFKTAGDKYTILIEEGGNDWWNVEFLGDKGSVKVSNVGNQFQVFSTVLNSINEFIKEIQPAGIEFSAEKLDTEDVKFSRSSLYDTLVSKYAKKIGYFFKIDKSITNYQGKKLAVSHYKLKRM